MEEEFRRNLKERGRYVVVLLRFPYTVWPVLEQCDLWTTSTRLCLQLMQHVSYSTRADVGILKAYRGTALCCTVLLGLSVIGRL